VSQNTIAMPASSVPVSQSTHCITLPFFQRFIYMKKNIIFDGSDDLLP